MLGQGFPEDPGTLLPSLALSHASPQAAHAEPGSRRLHPSHPGSTPADPRQTRRNQQSRFRVTCPRCPSPTRRGGGRAEGERRGPGKPGGPDRGRLQSGRPPLRGPSPASAPRGSARRSAVSGPVGSGRAGRWLARWLVHSPR